MRLGVKLTFVSRGSTQCGGREWFGLRCVSRGWSGS